MTESIGTARLDIVVDTSSLDAAATKATRTTQDIGKAAQGASASMEQNSKRQVASLEKQIATLGKSREEIIRWRIEQQTSGKVAADLAAKLEAQVKHLNNSGRALNAYGQSAKQTAAALRGLPAQITDIVTGLASGQRPLTLLFQQGGQIKDMFGGIVPAARALGGAIFDLVNPFTIAAGAVLAYGLALKSAADEHDAITRAIILTGNAAHTSADQIEAMASRIAAATSATKSASVEAVTQAAATGRFTADQIEQVAKAAINMKVAAGTAIEDTIAQFVRLADDPVRAIEQLDKSQHLLSDSTKRQIASLQQQGKQAEATALAIASISDVINSRAGQIEQHLSGWSLLWKDVGTSASGAFDFIKRGLAESDASAKAAIGTTQALLSSYSQAIGAAVGLYSKIFALRSEAAKGAGSTDFTNVISGSSTVAGDFAKHRGLPADFGLNVAPPEPAKEKTPRIRGGGSLARHALPDFSKDATAELQRQAEAEDRATQSFLDMQAALDGPLAQAEREHAKRVAELNDLASKSPEAAAGLTAALEKEAAAHAKNVAAIKAELDPLGQLAADMQFELEMIGKSNAERAVMIELRRNHIDALSAEGQAALANAKAFEAEAQAKQQSIDLMDDFRRGAADALTEFVTGAKSAKDALKDFFNTLAEEITRAIANRWIQQLFGQQGTSGQGTSGGNVLGGIFNSIFGGGGWGGIAKGEAFPAGVTPFASGGIVSSPHLFASAGRLGLMGEAGPEAILPLHRGPDGKLGVRMAANDDMPRHLGPAVVNQTVVVQGRIDSRTPDQFAQATARAQNRASTRNR